MEKVLTAENINPRVHNMVYAVRGEVPLTAGKIAAKLANGDKSYPFDEILYCNIGNPQSVGQKPITYYRQVMAALDCPTVLDSNVLPPDVVVRARSLGSSIVGGTGAYTHSQGLISVRKEVARFCEQRDGHPCDPETLFLTNGASNAIAYLMTTMLGKPNHAVMIPKPQYPIYTALLSQLGAQPVFYELDEEAGWTVSATELKRAYAQASQEGLEIRAMVVINPGNPTGQCLDVPAMQTLARFCKEQRLVLMADEVYQENVYTDTKSFTSFKKVVRDLGSDFDGFELASFHSTSKGLIGECGRRGGYMELCGFDHDVFADIYKLASSNLCSNLDGQIMTALMVSPPHPGDASYPLFDQETRGIFESLKRKATKLVEGLKSIEGVSCQQAEGAMYVFPQISLSPAACQAAEDAGKSPDTFYCLSLLENTGICCVPGSGFGQKTGSWHLRATFLPPEEKMDDMITRFTKHHNDFSARYATAKSKL